MIFSKNVVAVAALLLSVSLQAHAHAAITPMLGVKGNAARGDVQRPSTAKPCGNINIAQTLDTTTAIPLNADGTFTTTIKNFNAGADGSLQIASVKVDPSGTGKSFVAAQMTKNGERNPTQVKAEKITAKLPASAKCNSGKSKNKCLVSLTTTAGFGNCVVVQAGAKRREDVGAVGTRAARAVRLAEENSA